MSPADVPYRIWIWIPGGSSDRVRLRDGARARRAGYGLADRESQQPRRYTGRVEAGLEKLRGLGIELRSWTLARDAASITDLFWLDKGPDSTTASSAWMTAGGTSRG